jgi:hypothetical protein
MPPATKPLMAKPSENGSLVGETAKRKRGGQPNNRNALRHGLRGTGKLPRELAYLENKLNCFRRLLEDTVLAAKGEINLCDASAVNTALKWEKHGALAQRWLTTQYAELKPADRLTFSREVARASAERDKAIAALNIAKETRLPWLVPPTQIEHADGENHD